MLKPNLLVTGGLGNLGSWIVQEAINNFNVTVLARSPRKVLINGNYSKIFADLSNPQELKESLKDKEFQYVIHAGSVNDVHVKGYDDLSYKVNTFGTRNLLEALNLQHVDHFIYLSTFHVYGLPSDKIINEKTETNPVNDYAMSHLFAENLLSMILTESKFSIVRLTNSYGCPKDLNSSKWYLLLNDLSRSAFYDKEIKLNSNGKALRDFIWMGDVCEVLLKLLQASPRNEVYNVSSGNILSTRDIAEKVQIAYKKYFRKKIKVTYDKDDSTPSSQSLNICNKKIKDIVQIEYKNMLIEEAINIFKLLESKS